MDSVSEDILKYIELKVNIEKEAKEITILFADLVGSTHYMSSSMIADGLVRIFVHNNCISNITSEFNGTVVKFIGDAVMVTFDSPYDAINAAISINNELSKINLHPRIETKIGIHKGKVWFFKYRPNDPPDPQGEVVNVAYRLTTIAKGSQILITEDVITATEKQFKTISHEEFIPRGMNKEYLIHALEFDNCESNISKPTYTSYINDSAKELLDKARKALSDSDYKSAFNYAISVLNFDAKHPEACYIAGAASVMDNNNIDEGINALMMLLRYNITHYIARYMLGHLFRIKYEQTGNREFLKEAVTQLKKSLEFCKKSRYEDIFYEYKAKAHLVYCLVLLGGENDIIEALSLCDMSNAAQGYEKLFHYWMCANEGRKIR